MAVEANDLESLREYAKGVMGRADHHADEVEAAALALLGGIIWRADPGSIRVKTYAGHMANLLWLTVEGREWVFAYAHQTGKIEIRERNQNGRMVYSVDNNTPLPEILGIIKGL